MSVLIETTLGDIVIDLFIKERTNTSKNFLKLCKIKYYNLCQFFTIETNYIAQTGDPTNSRRGGESIFGILFGDQARYFEMEQVPKLRHSRRGLVSMVNNGNDMIGSQFFITLADELDFLDGKHCIFGQVTEGIETVEKLNAELVDESNKPYRDIRIAHTFILDDPFEDLPRMQIPRRSPSPTIDLIKLENQIALDEKVDEDEGKSMEELKKELEEKEMKAQAQILTMVGDLHHAEERPPDNVLFVCKLNPVTTDEDLDVIFSRFGTILCCEVIRDRRTGASLQYAFIEFEKPEQCEQAFLKMDNVLIDDRRIHVDFSQSVAKNYQWKKLEKNQDKDAGPKREENGQDKNASPKREENRQDKNVSPKREESRHYHEKDYGEKRNSDHKKNRRDENQHHRKESYGGESRHHHHRRESSGKESRHHHYRRDSSRKKSRHRHYEESKEKRVKYTDRDDEDGSRKKRSRR